MEQSIRVNEYVKPLTALQKKLTNDLQPSGDIYVFRLYGTPEHPMHDKVKGWLKENEWKATRDETNYPMFASPNNGLGNIMFLSRRTDPASTVKCVLDDQNLNAFLSFVREDPDLRIERMHHLGKAYQLTAFEYGMLLHQKQEIIDDWMKLQVAKSPFLTKDKLAEQFRMEGYIERSNHLHAGMSIYDPECKWARMEIDRLIERGELELKNVKDRDGYGVVRLAIPQEKEPEWKDVSKGQGMFRIEKETEKGTIILSMDDSNHVLAKAEPFQPTKKPKILYKGKSLNEGMRAAENFIQRKQPSIR